MPSLIAGVGQLSLLAKLWSEVCRVTVISSMTWTRCDLVDWRGFTSTFTGSLMSLSHETLLRLTNLTSSMPPRCSVQISTSCFSVFLVIMIMLTMTLMMTLLEKADWQFMKPRTDIHRWYRHSAGDIVGENSVIFSLT